MKEKSIILELDRFEKGILINALNDLRNMLIKDNKDTLVVDELLLKIFDAPEKKRYFHPSKLVEGR